MYRLTDCSTKKGKGQGGFFRAQNTLHRVIVDVREKDFTLEVAKSTMGRVLGNSKNAELSEVIFLGDGQNFFWSKSGASTVNGFDISKMQRVTL